MGRPKKKQKLLFENDCRDASLSSQTLLWVLPLRPPLQDETLRGPEQAIKAEPQLASCPANQPAHANTAGRRAQAHGASSGKRCDVFQTELSPDLF